MSEQTRPPALSGDGRSLVGELERLWQQGERPDPLALLAARGPRPPAEAAALLAADQWLRIIPEYATPFAGAWASSWQGWKWFHRRTCRELC